MYIHIYKNIYVYIHIFGDYKWDLFAISGCIRGSALPTRVCGHKNAKRRVVRIAHHKTFCPLAVTHTHTNRITHTYSNTYIACIFVALTNYFLCSFRLAWTKLSTQMARRRTTPNALLIGAPETAEEWTTERPREGWREMRHQQLAECPKQQPLINYHAEEIFRAVIRCSCLIKKKDRSTKKKEILIYFKCGLWYGATGWWFTTTVQFFQRVGGTFVRL